MRTTATRRINRLVQPRRFYRYCDDIRQVEKEVTYYAHTGDQPPAEFSDQKVSDSPGRFRHRTRGARGVGLDDTTAAARRHKGLYDCRALSAGGRGTKTVGVMPK